MAAPFASYVALKAALPGIRSAFQKVSLASPPGGYFSSSWTISGVPAAGANPPVFTTGSGYSCDATTLGALAIPAAPGGGKSIYIGKVKWSPIITGAGSVVGGLYMLYDRQWACRGFVGNTSPGALQTVTTPGNLPARPDTTGEGIELWVVCYSAFGATSRTLTVEYLNQAGGASSTTFVMDGTVLTQGLTFPIPLASGDTGVRQITRCSLDGDTGAAGDFGFTLQRRILEVAQDWDKVTIDGHQESSAIDLGVQKVDANSCLMWVVSRIGGSAPVLAMTGEVAFMFA